MGETFNVYCDESCHLEHDQSPVMVLGAVWCPLASTRQISQRIAQIKIDHDLTRHYEIKWTKVSPSKEEFFKAVIDYFFDDDDLHFRGVLILDKGQLDHVSFKQDHDAWYYKMCFTLLEPIIDPTHGYRIYLDIKDTRSEAKRRRLERILRNKRRDHAESIIQRVQQIRSHESPLLQLADLLIGGISHFNRTDGKSQAKKNLIDHIRQRSRKQLDRSTWLRESKFNLFRWEPTRRPHE